MRNAVCVAVDRFGDDLRDALAGRLGFVPKGAVSGVGDGEDEAGGHGTRSSAQRTAPPATMMAR